MFALFIAAPFFLQEFRLGLLAKFLCFAIVAVGICLIWGYTGILSLGHGVFFGLGAYCMAMYLKIEASPSGIPDFMEWAGVSELPWIWALFRHPFAAIAAAVAVPVLLAFLLGYFTFRNNIKGVYFSLISQAVVVVVVTLFIGSQEITGGTNGLTSFYTIFQYSLADPALKQILYFATVFFSALLLCSLCFLREAALAGFCRRFATERTGCVFSVIIPPFLKCLFTVCPLRWRELPGCCLCFRTG